jgi:hypothetical protein
MENNYKKDVIQKQSTNSNVRSEKYSNFTMMQFECCPNRKKIQNLVAFTIVILPARNTPTNPVLS